MAAFQAHIIKHGQEQKRKFLNSRNNGGTEEEEVEEEEKTLAKKAKFNKDER
jgi:hypothetical protein